MVSVFFVLQCADYTPENPKIITKCSHHFHLSCIYEWMERSETCPVCGKVTRRFLQNFKTQIWSNVPSISFIDIKSASICIRNCYLHFKHLHLLHTWMEWSISHTILGHIRESWSNFFNLIFQVMAFDENETS